MNVDRILTSARIRINEFPRRTLRDSYTAENDDWKIPNTCYQTWVNHKFGRSHLAEIRRFRQQNSDLSFVLYNDVMLNKYMRESWGHHPIYKIFLNSKFGPMRADIFRYCILYEKGGYYFDISKGCNVSIRSMHSSQTEAIISFENNNHHWEVSESISRKLDFPDNLVIQWGFGFVKGHLILKRMIDSIVKNEARFLGKVFAVPKEAILDYTGPRGFTRVVHDSIGSLSNETLIQAGVDFFGYGRYALKGSYVRYFTKKHYTEFSDSVILGDNF